MFLSKTCEIKISYVDYVVSRTIITAFDEWLDALDESKNSYFLRIGRKFSHFIPATFKYISLIICSLFIINMMPILIGISPSISDLSNFSLLSFLFIFFTYKIASFIGQFVENSIYSSSDISYLDVTKGDKKLIKEALSENNKSIIKTISGSTLMIFLNFLAKYLAIHLKI